MKIEKSTIKRYAVFLVVVVMLFGALIYQLHNLQVVNAGQFQQMAASGSFKTFRLTGKRGMITDAESVVLAMSEDVYNVTFLMTTSEMKVEYYKSITPSILKVKEIVEAYGSKLTHKLPIEYNPDKAMLEFNYGKNISEKTIAIREGLFYGNHYLSKARYPEAEDVYNYLFTLYQLEEGTPMETALEVMGIYSDMRNNIFNSMPIIIAPNIPFEAVQEISGQSMSLHNIDISVGEKRVYPRSTLASQVIGYVGPISESDNYQTALRPMGYALNDIIGKDGIEKSMENWLTPNISSRTGSKVMENDNQGRLTRLISSTQPTDGNNVKLTLIEAYQREAERAIAANVAYTRGVQETEMFRDRWREANKAKLETRDFTEYPLQLADTGTMMVVEVNTGKVLAMAQHPTYDLNAMVAGGKEVADILLDERRPLWNFATQSTAEPGSIFKMVTGLAALTNGRLTVTEEITDTGPFMGYTTKEEDAPLCWIAKGYRHQHANLNIVGGLSKSCNFFFYTLAEKLYGKTGSNLLYQYAAKLGLTTLTGIQLPGETRSIVGNQTSLYDPSSAINMQETNLPILVAAKIKKHLQNVGASYGIQYDDVRLNACIKQLMDMALVTNQGDWPNAMRPILMAELNMTRDMVWLQAVIGEIWYALNDIKWGGSMEVQVSIGQSITQLTPAAVSRYVAALGNGGTVYNLSIVDSIISPEGEILNQYQPSVFGTLDSAIPYLPFIREGMKGVVDEAGTARRYFNGWAYEDELWAKTGTSQVTIGGIKLDLENNGWFVALAPFNTPAEIAVVVLIPNGKAGAEATRAARDFIGWWFEDKNKFTGEVPVVPGNQLMP